MFEKVFRTTNTIELHGTYIWTIKLAASFLPLLSTLEVSLRNAIHNAATNLIGPDWYNQLATRVRSSWSDQQRDMKNIKWHKKQVNKVEEKIKNKTPAKGLTKRDLIVAKFEFGFWDNLLRECFSVNGSKKALWPQCMPHVFPNRKKGQTNSTIQTQISELRELRNDISHNHPIWKHSSVTDEMSAITYLNERIDKIVEIIGWLSKDAINWLEVHMLVAEARRIATKDFLYLCQRKSIPNIETKSSKFRKHFHRQLAALDKNSFTVISHKDSHMYVLTKITNH
ncbi:Abi family protein [Acinetobacter nosocomialis]|uniref:Abi family protein n=1 Tax=Acinetobacter calcoaceticus/baumannii complex TaxID=909768 RepID=UPI00233F57F4|nr:Abi family protein [Acinetobacter baumannii]MDC5567241.1 Abi family protein [Acinetobacter baumannii]MDK2172895.1 Abi family protein [Acinetobacter baumannii]MDK2183653.1 Abi family protein [Acinetobacter baumannii]MDK2329561.1 Abi family protein [Acinetobacter baumannii]